MKFVEMTGAMLREIAHPDELQDDDLTRSGVRDDSIVRVNEQGDVELRRTDGWDVVGGLLGEFATRVESATGLKWA